MTNPMRGDHWIKCVSTHGNIRGIAIQATNLVQEMSTRHSLEGIFAQGMGEAAMAAILIASFCKNGERVNLNVQGSGFFKQALVDAYPDGSVRGYVVERNIQFNPLEDMGPWGTGLLSVLRTKNNEAKQPYIGTVPLLTGHLAKDITFYWMQSEQIPSAVGLVVNTDQGKVTAAGGFLVQALPGASSQEIALIDHHIQQMHSLEKHVTADSNPLSLLTQIFQSTAFMMIEEKELKFKCNCSWERVERALTLVGPAELKAMLQEDQFATVRCDFCAKEYKVEAATLQKLIDATSGSSSNP